MLVLLYFVLLCKIHVQGVFCIGKGKMAVNEVFQLMISTAKLRLLK